VPPRGCDPGVFPFLEANVNRCVFLVDGLNLYHSLLDAERETGRQLRRLDVAALCESYLHALPGQSRSEAVGKHSPSVNTLKKYARAVGCEVEIRLVSAAKSPGTLPE
jgi:hypothetical protein